jgi:hypothetical protein
MKETLNYAIFAIILYFLLTEVFEKFSLEKENLEQENLDPVVNPGNLQIGTNATTAPANLTVTGSSTTEGDVVFGGKDANGFMWDNEADNGWACLRPALDTPGNPNGSRLCFNKDHGMSNFGPDGSLSIPKRLTVGGSIVTSGASGGFYMPSRNGTGEEFSWYNQDGSKVMLWNKVGGNILSVDVSGNTGIGGSLSVGGTINANNKVVLNNNKLVIRSSDDTYHTIEYNGSVDGPIIRGYNGGALFSTGNGEKIVLRWENNGNVSIPNGSFTTGGSIILNSDTKPLQIGPYSNNNINFLKDYGIQISSAVNTRISSGGLIVDGTLYFGGSGANGWKWCNENSNGWACLRPAIGSDCANAVGSRLCFHKDHGLAEFAPGGNLNIPGNINANAFNARSDQRLKTNIEPLKNVISSIKQINGVKFNYKTSPNKKSIGLIAQEVEKVFPELVSTDDTADKIKSVSYSNMVGVLVEAVKEQQKMIEELQATVKILMSKL